MTCYTRCGNYCCPNTPRPIQVVGECSTTNSVINPTIPQSYAYLVNTDGGTVDANTAIPLTLSTSQGDLITVQDDGTITLASGTYEISYSFNATLPSNGSVIVSLTADQVAIPASTSTVTASAGNQVLLSKTIILPVTQTTILALLNDSSATVTFSNASLTIRALS